jgi:regulator of protease activity HflC (stomatin/prohibitin superfamily)
MTHSFGKILFACAVAFALPATAQKLYKYTDPVTGKVVYTDKLPPEAAGKATEQLNRQGTVVRRNDAAPTPEQLAAREAERRKRLEDQIAAKEEKRKNAALLNTYSSENDIDEARERALKANAEAIRDAERKLAEAQKREKELAAEAEFYQKKPMPKPLQQEVQSNQSALKAVNELLDAKRKETAAIHARYDEDKRRFLELTKTSAVAGGTAPARK